MRGRDDLVELLAGSGASTELVAGDLAVAAVARGEYPNNPLPADVDSDQQEVLILAALRGQLELVVELLGPRFFGNVGGGPPGTLLHHACWVGNPALVGANAARAASRSLARLRSASARLGVDGDPQAPPRSRSAQPLVATLTQLPCLSWAGSGTMRLWFASTDESADLRGS